MIQSDLTDWQTPGFESLAVIPNYRPEEVMMRATQRDSIATLREIAAAMRRVDRIAAAWADRAGIDGDYDDPVWESREYRAVSHLHDAEMSLKLAMEIISDVCAVVPTGGRSRP